MISLRITAEPNGYAIWKCTSGNMEYLEKHPDWKSAIIRTQVLKGEIVASREMRVTEKIIPKLREV